MNGTDELRSLQGRTNAYTEQHRQAQERAAADAAREETFWGTLRLARGTVRKKTVQHRSVVREWLAGGRAFELIAWGEGPHPELPPGVTQMDVPADSAVQLAPPAEPAPAAPVAQPVVGTQASATSAAPIIEEDPIAAFERAVATEAAPAPPTAGAAAPAAGPDPSDPKLIAAVLAHLATIRDVRIRTQCERIKRVLAELAGNHGVAIHKKYRIDPRLDTVGF